MKLLHNPGAILKNQGSAPTPSYFFPLFMEPTPSHELLFSNLNSFMPGVIHDLKLWNL